MLLAVLPVVMYFSLSFTLGGYFASLAAALWFYIMGYWVLKDQAYPFALPMRLACVALIWSITLSVTMVPLLIYGGHDPCSEFDPSMMNELGQAFHDLWVVAIVRVVSTWVLAVLAVFLCAADHPASTYIRQSVRCVLYYWLATAVRCIDGFTMACTGEDRDQDGVRDDTLHTHPIPYMAAPFGTAASLLGDIWCIQLVMQRLVAFQEAFGEELPCMKAVRCLSLMMKVCMVLVGVGTLLDGPIRLAVNMFTTFCLLWLVVLVCWAYSLPLQALRNARELDRRNDVMGEQLLNEGRYAMRVILAAQLGFVMAGFSMALFLVSHGLLPFSSTNSLTSLYVYAGLSDTVGNAVCVSLLSVTSLSWPKLFCCPRKGASTGSEKSHLQNECTCGQQMGRTVSQSSQSVTRVGAALCEACAWQVKVAELASRRVSVAQLLDFYAQLGCETQDPSTPTSPRPPARIMPHYEPGRSTTNDVVRHAIIPASRHGPTGKSLADTWYQATEEVGPVEHHFSIASAWTTDHAPRSLGVERFDGSTTYLLSAEGALVFSASCGWSLYGL